MVRILKDPVWQFVGVVIGIIAIVVSVILYYKTLPVKRLRVEILSNSPLVSISSDVPKEIQILYKGKLVQALSVILLKISNTGTEPIKDSDYSEPIRLSVSENAEVGQVTVQETQPIGIPLAPRIVSNNQVELARVLFNPGDQAVLKILVINNDSTLRIAARIVGVRNLEIQSVFDPSIKSGKPSLATDREVLFVPLWIISGLFSFMVFIIVFFLIWQSRRVIQWRKTRFGFNPAQYFYNQAQEAMLAGPHSTRISSVMQALSRAFFWDRAYVEKAKTDPLFSTMQDYERFKTLTEKYVSPREPSRKNRKG